MTGVALIRGRKAGTGKTSRLLALAIAAVVLPAAGVQGANRYFDVNGTAAGSGVADGGVYTWDSGTTTDWDASDGTGAATTFGSGNTAIFSAGTDAAGLSYTVNLGGAVTAASISVEEGNLTLGGAQTLTLSSGISIGSSAGATTLGSASSVVMSSSQTWTNNSSSTFTISSGIKPDTSSRTLTFAGTGNTVVNGVMSNNATLSLNINAPVGTVSFTGANTYTGSTTISAGTLKLDFASSAQSANIINNTANSSALSMAGGTLNITGAGGATNSQRFASTTLSNSSSIQMVQNGATSLSLSLGTITRNAGATLDLTLPTSGTVSTSSSTGAMGGVLTSASTNGTAYATVGGTDWASNVSSTIGKLASYDVNDFSAATRNADVSGTQTPAAFTVNTLRFNQASTTLTLGSTGPSTLNAGGILVTSAGDAVIGGSGAAALRPGGGKELVVINNGSLEFASPVVDSASGATAITLVGPGTTKFSASATTTGALNMLSTASTLNLNGAGVTVSTAGGTIAGLVTGTGGIIKNGTGTLNLSGAANNDYSGGTTINGGILQVNTSTTVAGGAITKGPVGTGTLTLGGISQIAFRANPVTLANNISTSGFISFDGTGASYSLVLDQTGVTGATGITLTGNTTFYDNNTSVTINDAIGGTGDLALTRAGSSGGMTLNGAINMHGNLMTAYLVIPGTAVSPVTVAGAVGSNVSGVVGNAVGGTLALTNSANAYTGPSTVYAGALQAASGISLPSASNLVLNGGVFQSTAGAFTRALGASGDDTVQFGVRGGGFSANGTAVSVNIGGNVTPDTLTWGSANFLPDGSPLILGSTSANNALTFQNPLDLNGKTQVVAVIAGSGDSETISGAISNGSLIKNGNGTLTLSAANANDINTTIASGTLALSASGSLGANSSITFNSSVPLSATGGALNPVLGGGGTGVLNRISPSAGTGLSLGALTFTAGDGTVQSTYGSSGNASLTFASLAGRGAGATGNFVLSGGSATTNKIVLSGVSTGYIDPGIFFGGGTSSANFAYYDAGGYVRGINWGVDSGSSTTGATATIASTTYAKTTGAISAQATATFSGLQIVNATNGAQAFTLASGATVNTNAILATGATGTSASTTISGGTAIQPGFNADLVLRADGSNDKLTISTPILGNGQNNLVKSGWGGVTLGGTNSYTGMTYVNAGTLIATGANAIPGNLIINGGSFVGGSSAVNNFAADGSTAITLNAGSFSIGTSGVAQTIASYTQYGGAGSCNISSNPLGSMTVSGTTTIAGGTFYVAGNGGSAWTTNKLLVNGGSLFLDSRSNQGPITMSVGAGGFEIDQPVAGSYTAVTLNTNAANPNSTPTLILNGGLKYVGSAGNTNATYITTTGNNPVQSTISLGAGSHTFDIGHGGASGSDLVIQSLIGGAGSLAKAGAGMLELSYANSYTGATSVNAGTLLVSGAGSINSTSGITIDGSGATFGYSSGTPLTKNVTFGAGGGKFIYDSPVALTVLPTLSNGATFIYNSPAKLASALTVPTGQTLGGSGVLGSVTINGNLSPGNSPGQLTADSLTLAATATTTMEIGGTTLGSQYDNVTITSDGSLTYGGTLNVASYAGYDLNQVGTYNLFTLNGVTPSGDFAAVTVGTTTLSDAGHVGVWTGGSYEFRQSTGVLAVVPEPGTITLAVGVVAMGLMQRRRRHAQEVESVERRRYAQTEPAQTLWLHAR